MRVKSTRRSTARRVRTAVDRFPWRRCLPNHYYTVVALVSPSLLSCIAHTQQTDRSRTLCCVSRCDSARAPYAEAPLPAHIRYTEKYTARRRPAERDSVIPLRRVVNREPTACPSPRNFRKAKRGPARRVVYSPNRFARISYIGGYREISNPIYIISPLPTSVCVSAAAAICLSHPRVFCVQQLLLLSRRRSLSLSAT